MSAFSKKYLVTIAGLFSCRMLGLFMLIPVFTLYGQAVQGANAYLLGLALGAYGFSQGILQIPLGLLSDKFGRRPVIAFGLVLFVIGSLIGALSHSIHTLILARVLQGAGAIGSTLMALVADLTPSESRTKAMAFIGASIGMSFMIAMVLGPIIASSQGLTGIFYFAFCLGLVALVLLFRVIPNQAVLVREDLNRKKNKLLLCLKEPELMKLNLSIFFQHAVFTGFFYLLPLVLAKHIKTPWHLYLPLVVISFALMVPFIIFAEKTRLKPYVIRGAIVFMLAAHLLLFQTPTSFSMLVLSLSLFFFAFNLLEALLPSEVSKAASENARGTAMGLYSSFQFLGIFFGGLSSGLIYSKFSLTGILEFNVMQLLIWLTLLSFRVSTRSAHSRVY
jgi:predicted MFS family arabinose efflux permease